MSDRTVFSGTIVKAQPRRGRGPSVIELGYEGGSMEVTTFDPAVFRQAAENVGTVGTFVVEEKASKDGTKVYKNLISMDVDVSGVQVDGDDPPVKRVVIPGSGGGLVPLGDDPIRQLEQGFALAVRQRELLESFVRERMKEGEHYSDGKMFGSQRNVLLQPGAQLILYAHGYAVDFDLMAGPMEAASSLKDSYTLVVKAKIYNAGGRLVGAGLGSCSSLIWSSREGGYRGRAVDPDKTHNTTLKMAKKRALVDGCLNTTAASSYFTQDLEEAGVPG